MSLTVLNVAYPFAPTGRDAVGGAEQVLTHLDRALVEAGHRSIVIAQRGSQATGTLLEVPAEPGVVDEAVRARVWARCRHAIETALQRWLVDVVHLHGVDFHAYLPRPGVPVLATLHLPPSWYPAEALVPSRPDTFIQCVGRAQHEACPRTPRLLPPIENGVPTEALAARHAKRRFALMLGRICPEKGVHVGVDAAKRAGMPLIIAGCVFPYAAHTRYFAEEVVPRLDAERRFIGPVGFARKRRLLTAARCVLVPSLVPETSSLVTREALACGTPVIGFRNGALRDAVDHGRTGFLVDTADELAEAMRRAAEIDPEACRAEARERFSLAAMTLRYLDLYQRLARAAARPLALDGAA